MELESRRDIPFFSSDEAGKIEAMVSSDSLDYIFMGKTNLDTLILFSKGNINKRCWVKAMAALEPWTAVIPKSPPHPCACSVLDGGDNRFLSVFKLVQESREHSVKRSKEWVFIEVIMLWLFGRLVSIFLLKYSWFPMLCQFLLYSKVTQLYSYIHSFLFFPLWFIPGNWIYIPVLYCKTTLFIHSKCNSLYLEMRQSGR